MGPASSGRRSWRHATRSVWPDPQGVCIFPPSAQALAPYTRRRCPVRPSDLVQLLSDSTLVSCLRIITVPVSSVRRCWRHTTRSNPRAMWPDPNLEQISQSSGLDWLISKSVLGFLAQVPESVQVVLSSLESRRDGTLDRSGETVRQTGVMEDRPTILGHQFH